MMLKTLLLLGIVSIVTSTRCSRECQTLRVSLRSGFCNTDTYSGDYRFIGNSYYGSRAWKNTAKNKVIWLMGENSGTDTWALSNYSPHNKGSYYHVLPGYGMYYVFVCYLFVNVNEAFSISK